MATIVNLLYSPEERDMVLRERIENELVVTRSVGQVAAYEYLSTKAKPAKIAKYIERRK